MLALSRWWGELRREGRATPHVLRSIRRPRVNPVARTAPPDVRETGFTLRGADPSLVEVPA